MRKMLSRATSTLMPVSAGELRQQLEHGVKVR